MTIADVHRSSQLSLGFSCLGHLYSHLFAPIFYVIALILEKEWVMTHGEVVVLIVAGNVLFGVAAPLAGWLGDRWTSVGMMIIYFLGTGAAMMLTGLAQSPWMIAVFLALTGVFASIYHPVGIAWLVRNAESRGLALGINGVFGGIGPAVAALSAGVLAELAGWRAAFLVPGAIVALTGIAFVILVMRGLIQERKTDARQEAPPSKSETVRAFGVLAVTLLCTGLIYQATQPALPKVFTDRLTEWLSDGVIGVSMLVAVVYLVAGGLQILAGHLADRWPLKWIYITCFVLQVPFLFLAGSLGGTALVAVAMIMVSVNVGALPAENSLVARYAPSHRRGLVFGLKFILAFGLSGLGVLLEGTLYDLTGGFFWLFTVLAAIAIVGVAAGLLLPTERRQPAAAPAE